MASAKIAVSVPQDLLNDIERLRRRTRETRSAVVQRALRVLVNQADVELRASQYAEAYRRYPESDDEVDAADRAARSLLAEVAWDD